MNAYDQLVSTRPRLQRDVLFTETPQGVLFHNSKGGFHLNSGSAYRFASLVVPHLNGRATVGELADGLGDAQKAMMGTLVSTLLERGFARDVSTTGGELDLGDPALTQRFGAQLNYIDHYVEDAATRFTRFRAARIAVLGGGEVAVWCARGLARNGAATLVVDPAVADELEATVAELASAGVALDVEALSESPTTLGWADLPGVDVVVVAGRGAVAQVHRLEAETVPEGARVIPAWVIGSRSVLGPMIEADAQTPWTAAVRAIGRGRAADEAAIWEQVAQPELGSPAGPEGPLAAMIGNHLAYEVFRAITGCLPAETRDGLIIQDLDSLDVVAEGLLPDPALPATRPLPDDPTLDWTLVDPAYDAHAHEGAAEDDPIAVELNRRSALVQQHTGLIREFDDDAWTQTPLKLSSATVPTGRSGTETVLIADIDHVAAARLRVLDAAAVLHARTARRHSRSGRDLSDGSVIAAPDHAEGTGHAAAGTVGAAAVRALARSISSRAVLDALRGTPATRVDLDACRAESDEHARIGAELTFLLCCAELLEVELEVLELAAPAAAGRVALVRSTSHRDLHGVAAAVELPVAVRDAIVGVLGTVQARADETAPSDVDLDATVSGPPSFDPWTLQVSDGTGPERTATDWRQAATRLSLSGLTPVAQRTTTSALEKGGVETVAVTLVEDGASR